MPNKEIDKNSLIWSYIFHIIAFYTTRKKKAI